VKIRKEVRERKREREREVKDNKFIWKELSLKIAIKKSRQ